MSKFDDLIAELCPNGVEYKNLGEVFYTKNGYTPSKSNSTYWEQGTIPWFRMEDIRENGRILSKSLQNVNIKGIKGELFPANSLIVATSATIGEHALITVPFLANQRFTCLMLKDEWKEKYDIKFLFYYCYKLDEWCLSHLNQGNFASVDMKQFVKFRLPVPPLEIQREIVRVLDNFTFLTAELTAELTARRKQYEFYRNMLLTFKNERIDYLTTKDIKRDSFWLMPATPKYYDTGVPYITSKNIKNGMIDFTDVKYISEADYQSISSNRNIETGDLLITMIGTIGEAAFVRDAKKFYGQNIYLVRLDTTKVNKKYYYYYLTSPSVKNSLIAKKNASSQGYIKAGSVENLEIPIPKLEIQNKIVEILDRFDSLCNDISKGLPAEIAARKKQYEYYRDKLLTFKELNA